MTPAHLREAGSRSRPRGLTTGASLATLTVLAGVLVTQACTDKSVVSVDVASIRVDPSNSSLVRGDELQFRATVIDTHNRSLEGAKVTWSTNPPELLAIDQNGLGLALLQGDVQVIAQFRGTEGKATVHVIPSPTIALSRDSVVFFGGSGLQSPSPVVVDVTNGGGASLGGLTQEVSYEEGEPTGWLTAGLARQNAPTTLTLTPQTATLPIGVYHATVEVSSPDDEQSPALLPVVLSLINVTIEESDESTSVAEAGGTDDFTVALAAEPDQDVVFDLVSADTMEVVASPARLTFTTDDWDQPQVVTVTGRDELVADGDRVTAIMLAVVDDLSDPAYAAVPDPVVLVTVVDDDVPGFLLTESGGGTTVSETGTTDDVTVTLSAQPLSTVVLDVVSTDTTQVKVSPAQLSFTPATWSLGQTVTVTGVDDDFLDGPVAVPVVFSVNAGASADAFDGVAPDTVDVTAEDDDNAQLVVVESDGSSVVNEAGTSDDFTVVLSAEPVSNVVVTVSSDDATEVSVDSATVTFTPTTWNVAHTIVVTGVDDELTDGPQTTPVTLAVDPDQSDDDFDGVADAVVSVTTSDDDTPGFTITESDAATSVQESMTTDEFSVMLDAEPQPGLLVVLDVTSADPGEVSVAPSTLTFSPANWLTPQTVTVTGVDERVDDGDQLTDVVVAVDAAASDDDYDVVPSQTVVATTIDDDEAGVVLEETGGGTLVTEAGSTDDFLVSLNSEPTGNVVVDLSSANELEVTVAPSSMTFTPTDWDTPQLATVTGVDDLANDGNQFTVITASVNPATPDLVYTAVPSRTLHATTTDDDRPPGLTLTQIGGTIVNETGTLLDDFSVVLDAEPATSVTVSVTSSDPGEATVSPVSLTFTSLSWYQPQVVSVAGVDDDILDGNVTSTITVAVDDAVSAAAYAGISAQLSVTTLDDDVSGLVVADGGGISVNESGTTDQFTVALGAEPASAVTVLVSSSDTTEATVSPTTLNFSPTNWSTPQTVTVTGVDDASDDDDQTVTITIAVDDDTSDDAFDGLVVTLMATTFDDDGVGFTVTESGGSTSVTEAGSSDTFTLVLDAQPASATTVALDVGSGDTSEATVDSASVTFTPANWNVPKTVTVTGVDDDVDDGDQMTPITITVTASSDPQFVGLSAQVLVTTTDDDEAAVMLAGQSGIVLTETPPGSPAQFTVVLGSEPVSNVVIDIATSDNGEADVSPDSLVFTPGNWSTPQSVTVTGVDDDFDDDNQFSTITVSVDDPQSDDTYDPLPSQNFAVTTVDDDAAGLTVVESGGATVVAESGTTDAFTVALAARPSVDVVLAVTSDDTGEATVSADSLTFTTGNWNVPQTVTVTGVPDAIDDGDQTSTISIVVDDTRSDAAFDGLSTSLTVTTTDDDTAGFTLGDVAGLTVTEGGSSDTFTAVLGTQPTTQVVLRATTGDPGEVAVSSPDSLIFTNGNWSTPQAFTLQGVNDVEDDGDQTTTVTVGVVAASSDNAFDALPNQTVSVTTTDDDDAGFALADTTDLQVTEPGGTDAFSVVLSTQPSSNVVFDVTSNDIGEVMPSPATLTFTQGSWNQPQTVTLTGVNDDLIDGSQESLITVAVNDAASDNTFDGLSQQVSVATIDDDVAALVVVELGGTTVSESGTTDDFTVALSAQPTSNVRVDLASGDVGEATISTDTLTFTSGNWSTPRTVTVTGVDDAIDDGDQTTNVTVAVNDALSDNAFDGLTETVVVTTTDDDGVGFTITEFGGTQVSETGTQDQFGVALTSQPGTNVVLNVVSMDLGEATVSTGTLTFTNGTWADPQEVVVSGVNDMLVDDVQTTPVVVSVNAGASDNAFDVLPPDTVLVSTLDDDGAGYTVAETGASTTATEGGATDNFTVVLTRGPVTPVTFDVVSAIPTEAAVSPSTLTFDSTNWQTARTVTVTAVNDVFVDGPGSTLITVSVNDPSSDDAFDALPNQTLTVTTNDNDIASFSVTGSPSATEGGATGTFNVVLGAGPVSDVVLTITSADATEATISPASLTFTPANWNSPRAVTVTAVDDDFVDGPRNTTLTVGVNDPASNDAFDPLANQTVSAATSDNDNAGFTFTHTNGSTSVDESGTQDSVVVALSAGPLTDVVISVTSGDTQEAMVAPTQLTFTGGTGGNWDQPQVVVVSGVDDGVLLDGPQSTTLTAAVVDASSDAAWDPLGNQTLTVTTTDTDVPGFDASPTGAGTTVSENATQDSIAVVLTAQPDAGQVVVFNASSDDTAEATVAPASLTFGNGDWDAAKYFVVTGVNDATPLVDGPQASVVTIAVNPGATTANSFDGLASQTESVTTTDNDAPAYALTATDGGSTVSEVGPPDSLQVVLTTRPVGSVVFNVSNSDAGEVTVSGGPLTFDTNDWNSPKYLVLTGQNEATPLVDGSQTSTVTLSVNTAATDNAWDGVGNQTANVTTTDDDAAVYAIAATGAGTTVSESGTTDSIQVSLSGQPDGTVVFHASSDRTGEATVGPASLSFTTATWNTPQYFVVTGVQDATPLVDGTQASTITVTIDDGLSQNAWDGLADQSLSASTTDDDGPGIVIDQSGGSTVVDESGTRDSISVVLDAQPVDPVVFDLIASDGSEISFAAPTLTFTNANWNVTQFAVVIGEDDDLVDGNVSSTVTVDLNPGLSDAAWAGLGDEVVNVTTNDDDAVGFVTAPTTLAMAPLGSDQFTVVLQAEPVGDVVFTVSSDQPTVAVPDSTSLSFDGSNWDQQKTVTVTGVAVGSATVTVAIDQPATTDSDWDGLPAQTVSVTVTLQDEEQDPEPDATSPAQPDG